MSLYKSGGGVIRFFVLVLAASAAATAGASAQLTPEQQAAQQQGAEIVNQLFSNEPAPIIQRVVVQGNQRIEPETIGSYLPLQAGMPADEELLDVSLKTLFRTGLFSDVKLEMQPNDVLLIEVVENPIVNRVLFDAPADQRAGNTRAAQ